MRNYLKYFTRSLKGYLSHRPFLYAFIVGVGIVLFWRGVWHTADHMHLYIDVFDTYSSINMAGSVWWDGPLSLVLGAFILYVTGAFTSSFIGNELILSGLRGEKKLSEITKNELQDEVSAISDIKNELLIISKKLEVLEGKAHKNHQHVHAGDIESA